MRDLTVEPIEVIHPDAWGGETDYCYAKLDRHALTLSTTVTDHWHVELSSLVDEYLATGGSIRYIPYGVTAIESGKPWSDGAYNSTPDLSGGYVERARKRLADRDAADMKKLRTYMTWAKLSGKKTTVDAVAKHLGCCLSRASKLRKQAYKEFNHE